jgi:hypothetical protein
VTGVTRGCDIHHKPKYMAQRGLRTGAASVAIAAIHRSQISKVYGVLERGAGQRGNVNCTFLLLQYGVADVTILAHHFAFGTNVLAVVTAKTAVEIKMSDIVVMRFPIQLHFREAGAAVDSL